jgi:hypothetical protein
MRGRQLKRDVAINLVFTAIKVVGLLWITRMAGLMFIPAALSLFLLSRRFSGTAANFLQMGISQTIKRYVPMNGGDSGLRFIYVTLATLFCISLTLIVLPISYLTRDFLAEWFFPGTTESSMLAFWTMVLVLASVLHFVVYSTLTAERRMILANVTELMSASGYLLLALIWFGKNAQPTDLIRFQSVAMIVQSVVVIFGYLMSLYGAPRLALGVWRQVAVEFVRYGVPRGAITFLDMLIVSIGPWLLRADQEEVGYLLVALTVVRVFKEAIAPISRVASVVGARLIGQGNENALTEGMRLMLGSVLYTALLCVALLVPWLNFAVLLWLHDPTLVNGVLKHVLILVWGLLPLAIFYGLKEIIEVRWFQPLNAYTLILGSGIQVLVFYGLKSWLGVVDAVRVSSLSMFVVLGITTLYWTRSYLKDFHYWGLGRLLLTSGVLFALNTWLAQQPSLYRATLALAVSGVVIVACLVAIRPAEVVRELLAFMWTPKVHKVERGSL